MQNLLKLEQNFIKLSNFSFFNFKLPIFLKLYYTNLEKRV